MSDKLTNKVIIVILILFVICMGWLLDTDIQQHEAEQAGYIRYEQESIPRFNALKKPVILIGKTKIGERHYDIVVKDSNDIFQTFTSDCTLANSIGSSKNVGDTLK